MPWPTLMHMTDSDRRRPLVLISMAAVPVIRAPVTVYAWVVISDADLAQLGQALRGTSFMQFDNVDIGICETPPRYQFLTGRRGTDANDARWHACRRAAQNADDGCQTMGTSGLSARQDQGGGTIVDPRSIPRRDRSARK